MSKPWGGVGAWALDAERAEAEERDLAAAEAAAAPVLAAGEPAQSFPSLKESVAAGKSKKKKGTTVSLSEFTSGSYAGPGGARRTEPRGLTPDEILLLPTGPRERSADEPERSRLGGGFRSYGYGSGGASRFGGRADEGDGFGSRRSGFDEEQRRGPPSRASDFDQPSRADEADDWAANKRSFAPSPMDSGRHDRYSSLGSGGLSRADDIDDWSRDKKPLPSRYPSGFGSGYRDSSSPSDSDRWVSGVGGAPPLSEDRERPRLVLDPPKREAGVLAETTRTRPSPFGAARPREEILTEKGLDWRKLDTEIEQKKTSRPTSSHSSRPSSAQSSRPGSPALQGEGAPRARLKVNPFGDAKPREVVLEQKGKDWRKIDQELEHRAVDRPETDKEKILKEEISRLKEELKKAEAKINDGSEQVNSEDVESLHEKILHKEKDLELLICEFDGKIRFGQRTTEARRGSGAGRIAVFSPSGMSEELRSTEIAERPHSRGNRADSWGKPIEDKWGFKGSRGRDSLGSRSPDRSRSRERW